MTRAQTYTLSSYWKCASIWRTNQAIYGIEICNIACIRWRHCLTTSLARLRDDAMKRVKGAFSPHGAWIIDTTSQQGFKDVH